MENVPRSEKAAEYDSAEPVPQAAPVEVVRRPRPPYHYRAVAAVWFIVGIIDVLIAIRFVLKLLGASTASPFVTFMYGVTAPLVAPFNGIFGAGAQGSYVLEPASLVAIVIYALIGWGLVTLIKLVTAPRGTPPAS